MLYKILKDKRGVSLLEVIVAMGIFLLISGSVVTLYLVSSRSKDIIFEQLLTQNQGRKVVQDFVNEIRSATYSAIGAYPLAKASSTEIIFYTNQGSSSTRRMRYFLSGINLKRGIINPTGNPPDYPTSTEQINIVAESVTPSTTFYYYDQNYTSSQSALTQPVDVTAVRVVKIRFQLERNPNLSPTALNMQAQASLRNLKSN